MSGWRRGDACPGCLVKASIAAGGGWSNEYGLHPCRSQPKALRLLLLELEAEAEALPTSALLKGPLFPGKK